VFDGSVFVQCERRRKILLSINREGRRRKSVWRKVVAAEEVTKAINVVGAAKRAAVIENNLEILRKLLEINGRFFGLGQGLSPTAKFRRKI
jgi:hypothetical protein